MPKDETLALTPANEAELLNLVIQNCAKTILAAADLERMHILYPEGVAAEIILEGRRAELGRELGRLSATISAVLSTPVADSRFATEGMTRGQTEGRALLLKIARDVP